MAATPGMGYGDLKKKLLGEITARFQPFQEKYRHYQAHPDEVEAVLRDGADPRARAGGAVLEKARAGDGIIQMSAEEIVIPRNSTRKT